MTNKSVIDLMQLKITFKFFVDFINTKHYQHVQSQDYTYAYPFSIHNLFRENTRRCFDVRNNVVDVQELTSKLLLFQITALKIENNPFAKGFRGACNSDYHGMKR